MGTLRLILALAVVLTHTSAFYGFESVGGKIAVQAFYIISGFYMSMILNEKYSSYKLFITNRLLRLYPAYLTVLILVIMAGLAKFIFSGEPTMVFECYANWWNQIDLSTKLLLILSNLTIYGQDLILLLGVDTQSGHLFFTENFQSTHPQLYHFLFVPQAWTLGLELTFYLIAPLIVRRKLSVILFLMLGSLSIRLLLAGNGLINDPWHYKFFPSELIFFLAGNLSYKLYKVQDRQLMAGSISKIILGVMIVFTVFYDRIPETGWTQFAYKDIVYLTAFTLALPFIFEVSKNWNIDRQVGELSYPVYISHIFVMSVALPFLGKLHLPFGNEGSGVYVCILSVIFSILLNHFVNKPIERIRQKRALGN